MLFANKGGKIIAVFKILDPPHEADLTCVLPRQSDCVKFNLAAPIKFSLLATDYLYQGSYWPLNWQSVKAPPFFHTLNNLYNHLTFTEPVQDYNIYSKGDIQYAVWDLC